MDDGENGAETATKVHKMSFQENDVQTQNDKDETKSEDSRTVLAENDR